MSLIALGIPTVSAALLAAAVWLALAIDHWLGEPPARWHPVVWMGNYLGWAGRWVQQHARQTMDAQPDRKAFGLGAMAWVAGAVAVVAAACSVQWGLVWLAGGSGGQGVWAHRAGILAAAVLLGLLLKPLFAWALLRSEVLAVERALSPDRGGSLAAGRERLRWLVSRDATNLSVTQVRESAIETLAENLNDSVVAPIFWFLLLGLPGAALFRFANTADAMWGYPGLYQGRNWLWAGKWASHADDVLAWVPARLTALLLGTVAGGRLWAQLTTEAGRTPSPNSGWPMAAMALALGVRLAKPGGYVLHAQGRSATAADTNRAIALAARAVLFVAILAPAMVLFVEWARTA